MISDYIITCVE